MTDHEKGDHWLGKFVPYHIYRITSQHNKLLRKRLRRSGINIARWRVLAVLQDNGRMNISQIVERTIIEQPTVSRIVDQLEREGLAFREICDGFKVCRGKADQSRRNGIQRDLPSGHETSGTGVARFYQAGNKNPDRLSGTNSK